MLAMEELPESDAIEPALDRVLDEIAAVHAKYLGDRAIVPQLRINCYSAADYRRTKGVLRRMFQSLAGENRRIFSAQQLAEIERFLAQIDTEYKAVSGRQTLTHNDCCDRNLCVTAERIYLYDWELACYQNPEHDAVELVISVLDALTDDEAKAMLRHYRDRMTALTGITLTDAEYHALLRFNTLEFCVNKLMLLRLAGKTLHVDTPQQTAKNTARMLRLLGI